MFERVAGGLWGEMGASVAISWWPIQAHSAVSWVKKRKPSLFSTGLSFCPNPLFPGRITESVTGICYLLLTVHSGVESWHPVCFHRTIN